MAVVKWLELPLPRPPTNQLLHSALWFASSRARAPDKQPRHWSRISITLHRRRRRTTTQGCWGEQEERRASRPLCARHWFLSHQRQFSGQSISVHECRAHFNTHCQCLLDGRQHHCHGRPREPLLLGPVYPCSSSSSSSLSLAGVK